MKSKKIFKHNPIDKIDGIEQLNRKSGRTYRIAGGTNEYTSVTRMLSILSKGGIAAWKQRVGELKAAKISKDAVDLGSCMHKLAEYYLKNKSFTKFKPDDYVVDPNVLFNAIKEHLDDINNIRAQEMIMFSDELELAGTVDCIAEYKGTPSIIDFKSSKIVKTPSQVKGYFLQCCAYSIMLKERTGIDINQGVIILGSREGKSRVYISELEPLVEKLWETIKKYNYESIGINI